MNNSNTNTSSFYKINVTNSDTLIVSFAGHGKMFGGIQKFEFVNFLEKNFKQFSLHFYIDKHVNSYHQGIFGITNDIDETVVYLKNEIKDYKNVVFLGVSSGGYAAILFGSLLNINYVLAFVPQTIRHGKNNCITEKYRDISKYINDVTKYYVCGNTSITDPNDCHHISHCDRISHHSNVFIEKKANFDLKKMRDNGELYLILRKLTTHTTTDNDNDNNNNNNNDDNQANNNEYN